VVAEERGSTLSSFVHCEDGRKDEWMEGWMVGGREIDRWMAKRGKELAERREGEERKEGKERGRDGRQPFFSFLFFSSSWAS